MSFPRGWKHIVPRDLLFFTSNRTNSSNARRRRRDRDEYFDTRHQGWNISNNRSGGVDLMSWSLWTIAAKRLQPLLEPGGGRRGPWPAISCQVEKYCRSIPEPLDAPAIPRHATVHRNLGDGRWNYNCRSANIGLPNHKKSALQPCFNSKEKCVGMPHSLETAKKFLAWGSTLQQHDR